MSLTRDLKMMRALVRPKDITRMATRSATCHLPLIPFSDPDKIRIALCRGSNMNEMRGRG